MPKSFESLRTAEAARALGEIFQGVTSTASSPARLPARDTGEAIAARTGADVDIDDNLADRDYDAIAQRTGCWNLSNTDRTAEPLPSSMLCP